MDRNRKTEENLDDPWTKPWPADGLESVKKCPVCDETDREILHSDLVDNVFRAAPGKWSLWKCGNCGSAYLDPRPTTDTINLAYSNYYTHQGVAGKDDYASLSPLRKMRRRLVNGYTNWRFSTHEFPASGLGVPLLSILWMKRKQLESEYRHIPRRPEGGDMLLDVGCGSGAFLQIAQNCGWTVMGVDPDTKAVVNGRARGLNMLLGGLEQFDSKDNVFDVITLNHVIEHVHDPVAMMKDCFRLLKPGGQLWLETPNTDSLGHRQYGRDWRGLEPPRHLVIFNPSSLASALDRAGFRNIERKTASSPLRFMTQASEAIRQGVCVDRDLHLSVAQHWMILCGNIRQALFPSSREFLTVAAIKMMNIDDNWHA